MSKMPVVPTLRELSSTDFNIEKGPLHNTDDPFCVPIRAVFGPSNSEGEETFDFMVCNAKGLERELERGDFFAVHYVFVKKYDYRKLRQMIEKLGASCMADTWNKAAEKLSKYAHWEFDGYNPEA
jgi:hypothetical protein